MVKLYYKSLQLHHYQLDLPQGPRPQVDELLKAMQGEKILLIMDDFERALRAYSNMNAAYQGDDEAKKGDSERDCVNINAEIFLKSVCSLPNIKSKVLMTTRLTPRAIKPRGEFLLGCHEVELTAMQKTDAVAFFYKQKIKGTHAEIESACEPYGYHPLSLRILAGLIIDDRRTPGDISIANKLEITDNVIQNKHHVLEVSYNTLSPEQQKLLSTIACFRSPMNYEALKEISSKPLGKGKKAKASPIEKLDDNLKTLETRGLLHWDRKTNKYDLHPIVRRYAYERLTAPECTAAHTRLRDYFAAVDMPQQLNTLDDITPVIELYHHTVRAGELEKAFELLQDRLTPHPLFFQFGAYQLIAELLRALFVDGEHNPPRLKEERWQAWSLNELANVFSLTGQSGRAVTLFEQSIRIYEKQDNKKALTISLGNIADDQLKIGALHTAESNLKRNLQLSKQIADSIRIGRGYQELGQLKACLGQWSESEKDLVEAQKIIDKHKSNSFPSSVRAYQAHRFLLMSRDPAQSKIRYRRSVTELAQNALELAEEFARTVSHVERDFVRAYWVLGAAYRLDDQLDLAEHHLGEALARDRNISAVDMEADILLDFARLRYDQKNFEEAKSLAEEALLITERCGYVLQGADVNLFLAQYALEQEKDKVKAKAFAETTLKLAHCDDGPPYYYKVAYHEAERMLEGL